MPRLILKLFKISKQINCFEQLKWQLFLQQKQHRYCRTGSVVNLLYPLNQRVLWEMTNENTKMKKKEKEKKSHMACRVTEIKTILRSDWHFCILNKHQFSFLRKKIHNILSRLFLIIQLFIAIFIFLHLKRNLCHFLYFQNISQMSVSDVALFHCNLYKIERGINQRNYFRVICDTPAANCILY